MPMTSTLQRTDPLRQFNDGAFNTTSRLPVPLESTKVDVRILGGIAIVSTERTFRNNEARSIEATMTFPVPVHAHMIGLSARIGDRTVVGTAKSRTAAREKYEAAIDSGKTAILHEESLKGIHMLSVGHVAPGKTVVATCTWAATLAQAVDGAFLRIPTTVGDIYGRSPLPPSDDLSHGRSALHHAEVTVTSDVGTINLAGEILSGGKAKVRLDAPLDISVTGWKPRDMAGVSADGRAVTLSVTPVADGDRDINAILLLDRSLSMAEPSSGIRGDGSPTKHALMLRGLDLAVGDCRPGDAFHGYEYNTSCETVPVRGPGLAGIAAGARGPSGGTEIGRALDTAISTCTAGDILLVTDGKSHAVDVQKLVRSGRRITVVLIGEDSLDARVGHLAAMTGGQLFVASGNDADATIRMAIHTLRHPRVANVPVDGDLTSLETAVGGMYVRATWGAPVAASDDDSRVVGSLAAALAIPLLDETRAAALAEAHGIVCHLTSLVLVDDEAEAQEGIPSQRKIPLMAPRTSNGIYASAATVAVDTMPFDAGRGGALAVAEASIALPMPQSVTANTMDTGSGMLRPFPAVPDMKDMSAKVSRGAETLGAWSGGDAREERASAGGRGLSALAHLWVPGPGTVPYPGKPVYPDFPALSPVPAIPTIPSVWQAVQADLRAAMGRVDWSFNPDGLRRGSLDGLDLTAATLLRHASKVQGIVDLARKLGVDPVAVAIGLLAHAEKADRNAARVSRSILAKADGTAVEAAMRDVNLA